MIRPDFFRKQEFGVGDPEAKWEPFLDWLELHGVDPKSTYEVHTHNGWKSMCVAGHTRNENGEIMIEWVLNPGCCHRGENQIVETIREVACIDLPPRRWWGVA